jgi:hypothetical protein
MKKALKIAAIVVFVAFVGIQFIRPDFTNPPVNAPDTLYSVAAPPDDVRKIFDRSCADCHSNETKYPWYAKIQPSAWFLKDHIDEGRRELNISVWKTYEPRRQRKKLTEICEQIEAAEMPLPSYLWIHWDAKLSPEEIKTLCDWTRTESAKIVE